MDRLRRASKLPAGKTWDTFEHDRTSIKLRQQLNGLAEGDFVDRGVNVLAFGMPGTGKTHAMCAIGHRLVESSRSVLFIPAYRLVQDMLTAKRDLELPRILVIVPQAVGNIGRSSRGTSSLTQTLFPTRQPTRPPQDHTHRSMPTGSVQVRSSFRPYSCIP